MWNKVFIFFMELKRTIGDNFTLEVLFKDLIELYCTDGQKKICEPLQLNQKGELLLIRYGRYSDVFNGESEYDFVDFWDMFDGFYQECRSLVINLELEEIVLSPFKKFRNLGECEENSLENIKRKIDVAKSIEITDKLDGSMQSARWYYNEVIMSGSQSLSLSDSWRLTDGHNMLTSNLNYVTMLNHYSDCTFIFEYISLQDAHVVLYDKSQEGLYLIGIRSVIDGEQYSYKDVLKIANEYGVKTTKLYDKTLDEVMSELDKYKAHEKEGFVMNIDGYMVKIKCDDYVNIHRILSNISSINLIIQKISEDQFDDLIAKVPLSYRDRVTKVANVIYDYIKRTNDIVTDIYSIADKSDKKSFMIWVENNVDKELRGYVRNLYLGNENNYLKRGQGLKKLKDMGINDNYSALFAEEE